MRSLTLVFILVFIIPSLVWSKSIDLNALEKKTQQDLMTAIPQLKTNDFTRSDLEQALRWLVSSGSYDSAQYVSSDQKHYTFQVGKTKRVRSIKIIGNSNLGENELRQVFGVSEQALFDSENLLDAGKKVRLYYNEHGFYNSVINMEFLPFGKNEYDVILKISENIQSRFAQFKINTANPELQDRLQNLLSSHLNSPYTPLALNLILKDLKSFFVEKHYFKAELLEPTITSSKDESEVTVEFKIDHPESYFIDQPEKGKENFMDCIEAIGLNQYSSTAPNLSQEIASKIKSYYISLGYARVEVSVQEKEGIEPYHHHLAIDLKEGPRVEIEKIEFTGRFSKPEKYYINKLYDLASPVFAKHRFVKDDLDVALKNLIIDSENNGYFKAKMVSIRTSFNKDHDRVTITLNMDEGPLTQVQKISVEGAHQISANEILNELKLKPMDPLRLNVLETGIENVKKYYREHGFLDMALLNEKNEKEELVSYNEDNTLANLKFKVFEGPKVLVGAIVVEGNTITKDYVIFKELEFKQGDILTPSIIEESKARLQRLGIFGSVEIKTLEEKTMVSWRTVLVRVNDRNPGLFNTGIGYTSELYGTVRGFLGYAYRNIDGMARLFSARADLADNITNIHFLEKKATVSYLRPYLFDSRMRGRASLIDAAFVSDYSALNAEDVLQFTFSLEQEITSHLLVRWDVWNWAKYQDFSLTDNPQYPTTNVLIGSTGPTIELDYRDNVFSPTKGTFTRLNFEYGAQGLLQSSPQINFARAVLSFTHNLSVYKKIVWANHLRSGYLKNLEDPTTGGYTPWTQKGFLLGGPTTIRGFANAEAFPSSRDFGNTTYRLQTDASMYLFKSEFRIPLKGNLGILLFYDGGAVNITGLDYGFSYRHSVGFGALYNTPVGPASLYIGWKLNEIGHRSESPLAIDLSIGTF